MTTNTATQENTTMPTTALVPDVPSARSVRHTISMIEEVIDLDEQIKALEEQREALAAKVIDRVGVGNSVEVRDLALVTVVQNTSYTVDFDALVARRPRWAQRVTKKVLDQAKFTKLRQAEMLPADVAELVVAKPSAAHLRITKR